MPRRRNGAPDGTRPGGRIGLANWTPDGFVGGMFKIVGRHVPPPAAVASPLQWGSEDRLRELFAGHDVDVTRQQFTFRYPSPQAFFDAFRTYYGPVVRAWEALDEAGRASFEHELVDHAAGANRSGTALAVPSDYLEVVVTQFQHGMSSWQTVLPDQPRPR